MTTLPKSVLLFGLTLSVIIGLSLVLQESTAESSGITRVELDPISSGLYYDTWVTFGAQSDQVIAVSDDIAADDSSISTGVTRISDSKFQDFTFPEFSVSGIDEINSIFIEADVTKIGDKSNTVNLMLITDTKNPGWDFGPDILIVENGLQTISRDITINPLTGSAWTSEELSTWKVNGDDVVFGLNQQTKQKSDQIDVHEFRIVFDVVDTTPPTLTIAEPEIEVLFEGEPVDVDLGLIEALDNIDGVIIPETSDSTGPFEVGLHEITWTATDSAGNSVSKTQIVNVISIEFIQTINNGEANLVIEDHLASLDDNPETVSATLNSLLRADNGLPSIDIDLIRDLTYVEQYRTNIQFGIDDGREVLENCRDIEGTDPVEEVCVPGLYFLEINKINGDKVTVGYKGFSPEFITGDSKRFGGAPTDPTDPIRFTESDKYYIQSTATVRIIDTPGIGPLVDIVELDSDSDAGNVIVLDATETTDPGVYETVGITIVSTTNGETNTVSGDFVARKTANNDPNGAIKQLSNTVDDFEMVVYGKKLNTNGGQALRYSITQDITGNGYGFHLTDSWLRIEKRNSSFGGSFVAQESQSWDLGKWNTFRLIKVGSELTLELYKNQKVDPNTFDITTPTTTLHATDSSFAGGFNYASINGGFDFDTDNFMVWDISVAPSFNVLNEDFEGTFDWIQLNSGVVTQTYVGATNAIEAPIGSTLTATRTDNGEFAQAGVIDNLSIEHTFGPDTTLVETCMAGDPDNGEDTDFDGICDLWEIEAGAEAGLKIPTTVPGEYYTLPCVVGNDYNVDPTGATVCPVVGIPDLYIEYDYMEGHTPSQTAIENVVSAFVNSPYEDPFTGATIGVRTHIFVDNQMDHVDELPFEDDSISPTNFLELSQANFGSVAERTQCDITDPLCEELIERMLTAKRQIFRYGINAHDLAGDLKGYSGYAEKPGNNFMVTLGSFTAHQGSVGQQEGTLMHEIGHTLDLEHGGMDEINCKPNYPSVMNYLYQFGLGDGGVLANRPLDFSPSAYSTIDETDLDDDTKVLGSVTRQIVIGGIEDDGVTPKELLEVAAGTAGGSRTPGTADLVDWARDGAATVTTNLSENVHFYADISGCDDATKFGLDVESGFVGLRSQDDWGKVIFNFRNTDGFATGAINVLNDEQIGSNQEGNIDPNTPGIGVDAGADVTLFESEIYSPVFFIGNNVHNDSLLMTIDYGDGTIVTIDPENFEPNEIDHVYDDGTYLVTVSLTVTFEDGTQVTNTDTATITVLPVFDEVVFSEPLSDKQYEIGRTIPVKFTVIEDGEPVTHLNPEIWVSYDDADPNPQPAREKNSDNNIAKFKSGSYQYQMDSDTLPADIPVTIVVVLPDSDEFNSPHHTIIILKGS